MTLLNLALPHFTDVTLLDLTQERLLETDGTAVHPIVSSVVYLTGHGDPTIVFNQTLDDEHDDVISASAWAAHPIQDSFLTFRGDLLHGVMPAAQGSRPRTTGAGGAGGTQRLTLLIAWYATKTVRSARRHRLGPQAPVPPPTRAQSWPTLLELSGHVATELREAAAGRGAVEVGLPSTESGVNVWERIPRGTSGDAESRTALRAPAALEQHFFQRRPPGRADDVATRLWEEHGVGGTWTEQKRARKRSRA